MYHEVYNRLGYQGPRHNADRRSAWTHYNSLRWGGGGGAGWMRVWGMGVWVDGVCGGVGVGVEGQVDRIT